MLPATVCRTLKKAQVLQVQFPGEEKTYPAKILFIDPVATGLDRLLVRLEMSNPELREGRLSIDVLVPSAGKIAEAGAAGR
jgi:hypothetical protein